MDNLLKGNKWKVGVGAYKPKNESMMSVEPARIHFYHGKDKKCSVFEEQARRSAWVPGANAYSPSNCPKILGNTKT